MEKAEKFVVVNSRILDLGVYRKDFALLQKIIIADLTDYFAKIGFRAVKNAGGRSNFRGKMRLYNDSLDFEIAIVMKKKGRFEFV